VTKADICGMENW